MKQLAGTSYNITYTQSEENKFTPAAELILFSVEPKYKVEGKSVTKEQVLHEARLFINRAGIAALILDLMDIDKELKEMEEK